MFLRSTNHLMTFLLNYIMFGRLRKFRSPSGSRGFRGYQRLPRLPKFTKTFVPWQKSSEFISSRAKVAGPPHGQSFIVNFIVMSRNVMSCHVIPRHVKSCHVMSREASMVSVDYRLHAHGGCRGRICGGTLLWHGRMQHLSRISVEGVDWTLGGCTSMS